ncbi:class I SAM-dependent methyltransferase [Micrococcus endophyticus]|uniref:class I SAM-dependent methyltransferase n=1 Tax=Micrococcus endophyticus TaxID=455343 RepID=UPI0034CD111D
MDIDIFESHLSLLFRDFPRSDLYDGSEFSSLFANVNGLSSPAVLAVLSAAAHALDSSEIYLEAGSYAGLSAIAAAMNNSARLVLVDNFSMIGDEELRNNLKEYDMDERTRLIHGSAPDSLNELEANERVGVFYYDAAHDSASTLLSLRGVRRYLSSNALIVVDDFDSPSVRIAVEIFLSENSQANLIYSIDGSDRGNSGWWYGLAVILWDSVCT